MSIPNAQQLNIEIIAKGVAAARGDNAVNISNVFHYRRAATVANINKTNVESAFQTKVMIPLTNLLNIRYTQTFTTVRMMNDPTDAPLAFIRALPGAIVGDSMTSSEIAYILLQSGLRGKSYRGNKRIGPMSESDTTVATDDIWNAGALGRLATLVTAMTTTFTDADGNIWIPVIFSRLLQAKIAYPLIGSADIVAGAVQKVVKHLRKRQVKSEY